jgi:hypothetical protein
LDYSIAELNCIPATERRGVFGAGPDRMTESERPSERGEWVGEVLIHRWGTVSLPVEIVLVAEDGNRTVHHWQGEEPWLRLDYRGQSPLVSAVIDPDLQLPIDANLLNNARSLRSARTPRSFERLLYAAQWALFATTL